MIPEHAMAPRRSVLVVGSGPSRKVLTWLVALEELRKADPGVRLCLLNREGLGEVVPDFAVCVQKVVLPKLFSKKRHLRANGDRRNLWIIGPRDFPEGWPVLGAGAAAVWALTRLGFGKIYLYGLDGTAAGEVPEWIRGYEKSIVGRGAARSDGAKSDLVRVWPTAVNWGADKDPLDVAGTIRIGRGENGPEDRTPQGQGVRELQR